MSDTERSLLDAVLENPDEDLPRLVYADFLEEHGDATRAEVIRAQIAIFKEIERKQYDSDIYASATKKIIKLNIETSVSMYLNRDNLAFNSYQLDAINEVIRLRQTAMDIEYNICRGFIFQVSASFNWLRGCDKTHETIRRRGSGCCSR